MLWRVSYYGSQLFELPWIADTRLRSGSGFKRCIGEYKPDLVVSLHSLCQNLPLQALRTLRAKGMHGGRGVPFLSQRLWQ